MDWRQASILVTGGTGSFGRRFVELVLAERRPRRLIVYSRDECKQHLMHQGGLSDECMRYFIGDVRDGERLRRATQDVDLIVHAAAMKQVPICEYNPFEAVATNIQGSRNVIEAALDNHVPRVLALSTDKATAPLNLYGATKLVAEKLFVHANHYNRDPATRFACVRYGNVLGSRGSVVPLFAEQRARGVVTVTDPRMTRFWMTLDQGVRFVLSCVDSMVGGEVFIPKLPSMKVVDLARAVAPEARVECIGVRPGEKLHEALLSEEEARMSLDAGDRYVMLPADQPWVGAHWEHAGFRMQDGFRYTSDSNERWLSCDEMREMLHGCSELAEV
jgi:UDP-N-acetylglucosamine 4,6-dehydratase